MFSFALRAAGAALFVGLGALGVYWFAPLHSTAPQDDSQAMAISLFGQPLRSIDVLGEGPDSLPSPLPLGGGELILVFGPGCGICSLVAPVWLELTDSLGSAARLVGITAGTVGEARAWLGEHGLSGIRLFQQARPGSLQSEWGLKGTPLTLIVGTDLKVLFAKYGLLSEADVRRVLSLLAVVGKP